MFCDQRIDQLVNASSFFSSWLNREVFEQRRKHKLTVGTRIMVWFLFHSSCLASFISSKVRNENSLSPLYVIVGEHNTAKQSSGFLLPRRSIKVYDTVSFRSTGWMATLQTIEADDPARRRFIPRERRHQSRPCPIESDQERFIEPSSLQLLLARSGRNRCDDG